VDFCDFATRDDKGAHDSGPFVAGPARGVLHTTEGSTRAGARSAFVQHNSWPHFTITNETGTVEVFQHLPISRAGRSLEHRPGTVETNRQTAIQIEIVGLAAHSPNFSASYLAGIAKLMRWIEKNAHVAKSSAVTFVAPGHKTRLSDAAWLSYAGWCGHQHVPHNAHQDPGAIPIAHLLGP
jgi:N-acetylmuramoyl-L-alanine amidase-like protein